MRKTASLKFIPTRQHSKQRRINCLVSLLDVDNFDGDNYRGEGRHPAALLALFRVGHARLEKELPHLPEAGPVHPFLQAFHEPLRPRLAVPPRHGLLHHVVAVGNGAVKVASRQPSGRLVGDLLALADLLLLRAVGRLNDLCDGAHRNLKDEVRPGRDPRRLAFLPVGQLVGEREDQPFAHAAIVDPHRPAFDQPRVAVLVPKALALVKLLATVEKAANVVDHHEVPVPGHLLGGTIGGVGKLSVKLDRLRLRRGGK